MSEATAAPTRDLRLYEIPARLRDIEEAIAEAEGEITPEVEAELEALEETFERKVEYLALLSREARAEAKAVKEEEDRLAARRKAAENRERRLKEYAQHCMEAAGIDRVEGERAKVRLQKSPPKVTWMGEEDAIPEEFRRVEVKPDLQLCRDRLKSGAELPEGFVVTESRHLRVQ